MLRNGGWGDEKRRGSLPAPTWNCWMMKWFLMIVYMDSSVYGYWFSHHFSKKRSLMVMERILTLLLLIICLIIYIILLHIYNFLAFFWMPDALHNIRWYCLAYWTVCMQSKFPIWPGLISLWKCTVKKEQQDICIRDQHHPHCWCWLVDEWLFHTVFKHGYKYTWVR